MPCKMCGEELPEGVNACQECGEETIEISSPVGDLTPHQKYSETEKPSEREKTDSEIREWLERFRVEHSLYHVTSKLSLDKIRKRGLIPGTGRLSSEEIEFLSNMYRRLGVPLQTTRNYLGGSGAIWLDSNSERLKEYYGIPESLRLSIKVCDRLLEKNFCHNLDPEEINQIKDILQRTYDQYRELTQHSVVVLKIPLSAKSLDTEMRIKHPWLFDPSALREIKTRNSFSWQQLESFYEDIFVGYNAYPLFGEIKSTELEIVEEVDPVLDPHLEAIISNLKEREIISDTKKPRYLFYFYAM